MPRLSAIGLAPAATFFRPGVDQGLGEHGGGGGAVTGDVVGLGRDRLGQLRAEVLERVVELDLAGDGHAVVGDRRGAEGLGEHDVAALGAEGHLDGVGQLVDAALERAAGFLVEGEGLGHGCPFAGSVEGSGAHDRNAPAHATRARGRGVTGAVCSLLLDDGEDVARGEHEVLLAGVLDLGAAVLAVQDDVADGDVERDAVALVVDAARAHGEDGALLGLLLGGVRDDDAGGGGGLGLVGLDDDAVLERLDADLGGGHGVTPLLMDVLTFEFGGGCRRGGQPSSELAL